MNVLAHLIRAYQRHPAVNRAVHAGVRVHHRIYPGPRRPCPLAGQCSAVGLQEAQLDGWGALPGILGRMAACGGMDWDGKPFDECH